MKEIVYKIRGYTEVYDPVTQRVEQKEILAGVRTECTEENLEIAKAEAYNGEYTIVEQKI